MVHLSHPYTTTGKAMTNIDGVLKRRDTTLPTKLHIVKDMVLPVVMQMWKLDHKEGWAPENWCFQTVVLEKTLESPWTERGSNQSILKEINTEYSLEGLMLKLQYFGLLMRRTDSLKRPWCWERLKAGEEGDDRGWDGWKASPTKWTWVWQALGDGEGQGSLVCCRPWDHRTRHDWMAEQQQKGLLC